MYPDCDKPLTDAETNAEDETVPLDDIFPALENELNEAVGEIMSRHLSPKSSIISLDVEKPDDPTKGPDGA